MNSCSTCALRIAFFGSISRLTRPWTCEAGRSRAGAALVFQPRITGCAQHSSRQLLPGRHADAPSHSGGGAANGECAADRVSYDSRSQPGVSREGAAGGPRRHVRGAIGTGRPCGGPPLQPILLRLPRTEGLRRRVPTHLGAPSAEGHLVYEQFPRRPLSPNGGSTRDTIARRTVDSRGYARVSPPLVEGRGTGAGCAGAAASADTAQGRAGPLRDGRAATGVGGADPGDLLSAPGSVLPRPVPQGWRTR